jgi:glycosyltransferase involved in cell wall biosynthesis
LAGVRPQRWNWLHRFCHVPNEVGFAFAARREVDRLCRSGRVDVVWCHGHSTAMWMAELRKRFSFKIVLTVHGDINERPADTYDPLLARYYRYAAPRAYRLADRVHILSPQMADWTVRGGAECAKTVCIPNGIDPAEIGLASHDPRPAESFLPGGALRILYVGSLARLKGVDTLLHACAMVRSETKANFTLKVVGAGSQCENLRHLCDRLGLRDRVEFQGRVPRRELGGYYRDADVLCVPSVSDPFPTVVLEAAVSGLPVVASRTGGIPAMIDDGAEGFLVNPGDAADMARCLRRAGESKEVLGCCSTKAVERSRALFSWPLVGSQLNDVVRSLSER